MKFLHRIIFNLLTWITPIIIIFYSIIFNIADPDTYKKPLEKNNFYISLSDELKKADIDGFENADDITSKLVINTIIDNLTTPEWLEELFTKNIDLGTDWIDSEKEELVLYLPTSELQKASIETIDQEILEMVEKEGEQIDVCTNEQEEKIKREGYSEDQNFCLPEEVKSGDQAFTTFFGFDSESFDSGEGFLDTILKQNNIDPQENSYRIQEKNLNSSQKVIFKFIQEIKKWRLETKNYFPLFIIAGATLCCLSVVLALFRKKRFLRELRRISWHIGLSTTILSGSIIGIVWLLLSVNSIAIKWFFGSIISKSFSEDLIYEAVLITFNILKPAVFIGAGLIILSIIFYFTDRFILRNIKKKNKKLEEYEPQEGETEAFDMHFRKEVEDIKQGVQEKPSNKQDKKDIFDYPEEVDIKKEDEAYNDDVVPENYKTNFYDPEMYQESKPDPQISAPTKIVGIDYESPEEGENSPVEVGDVYFPRVDQESLELGEPEYPEELVSETETEPESEKEMEDIPQQPEPEIVEKPEKEEEFKILNNDKEKSENNSDLLEDENDKPTKIVHGL